MNNQYEKIIEIIKNRRSIRRFKEIPISTKAMEYVLDAARWAPCPNNYQPWYFYVVNKGHAKTEDVIEYLETKAKQKNISISIFIKDATRVLRSAGAVVYVFNTKIVMNRYKKMVSSFYQKKATLYEHQSISAAIQNLMLSAECLNIGTVWLGSPVMVSDGIEKIFKTDYELSAIIAMGYYDKKPQPTRRLELSEIATFL